ncbi:rhodopsin-like isoform X1 [Argopecten irradians]|uniref:rhodopsin-like isoform X1 n=2 Tax=Argopecten irradians TaxID=31199 RepID=UPI00371C0AA4
MLTSIYLSHSHSLPSGVSHLIFSSSNVKEGDIGKGSQEVVLKNMNAQSPGEIYNSTNILFSNVTKAENLFLNETSSQISNTQYAILAIFMFTVFLGGVIFNGLFVYVFLVHSKLKTRPNILLISLCISSFLIAALAIPFVGASAISRKWLFGQFGCVFHGFIVTALGLTQIAILTVLSFEKYIAIVKCHWSHRLTQSATLLLLFGCFMYGFLLAAYPLLGWNRYTMEDGNISCSIDWTSRSAIDLSYSISLLVIGLVVPLAVMSYVYISILLLIKKQTSISQRYKGFQHHNRASKRDVKVMKTILLLVFAFIISWLPYSIFAMTSITGYADDIHPLLGTLPSLFAKSSILWNPLIYVCRNRSFKRALLETFPTLAVFYRCTNKCRKRRQGQMANELTKMVDFQVPMSRSSQKSDTICCGENSGSIVQETGLDRNERATAIL